MRSGAFARKLPSLPSDHYPMPSIEACPLPSHALLTRYAAGNGYTDCFTIAIDRPVALAGFIEAFYTTWLFKLERAILAGLFACPSTDAEASELAAGVREAFAAWTVEARADDQILLCDLPGRTRSWLMVENRETTRSRLYFGSAITPAHPERQDRAALGAPYRALLGFHRLYARALLRVAAGRLVRRWKNPA